jgi:hypothetical protein
MMKLLYVALALVMASVFVVPSSMHAQLLQGVIEGNVTDSSGAAVPGARVTATHEGTGLTRATETNEVGAYSFPTVDTGSFTVKVEMDGFQTAEQTRVDVRPNAVTRINVSLTVGQVSETVTVEANAAVLQTDRAEVRQEVTETQLKNLPVPLGRNYQNLFVALPGFSPPTSAHSVPSNPTRSVQFSVNGTSRSNNNTRIDGASSTNIWLPHMTGYTPALEAIEQVNVTTNSMDAEQGLAGGAAINLSIKSGTNDIHGSAFEYHTNQHIKAYPWNSNREDRAPKFIYNQFGATLGGPIKKNKAFYFLSYEGTREALLGQKFANIGTAAMRGGDLSQVFSDPVCNTQNCNIFDPLTGDTSTGRNRTAFANAQIPLSRFDSGIAKIVSDSRYPLPNQVGQGVYGTSRNFIGSGSTTQFRDVFDSKFNFNMTDKWTSFVRFSMLDFRVTNDQLFGDFGGNFLHPSNSNPGTAFGNTYSGTLSTTYVATPNLIFDAYFGYTMVDTNVEQAQLDENIGFDFLGIPGLQSDRKTEGGWPRLQIQGFEQIGITNNFQPYFRTDPQWQWVANGNWTKGSHNVRFGTDVYIQHLVHNQPEFPGAVAPASGGFTFNRGVTQLRGTGSTALSRATDFNSWASFLLGLPNQGGKIWQFPDEYETRTRFYSFYVRDRWQINSKLTMSYGLRYEMFPFPTRGDRGVESYDPTTDELLVCGVGSVPEDCGVNIRNYGLAPRVGLAYRLGDNMVVRAGYGITNDPFNWARPLRTNYPVMFVQNLNSPGSLGGFGYATTLRQGIPVVQEPSVGEGRIPLPLTAAVTWMDDNAVRGYVQSWNFTMERRFGSWIGSAGYVATRSVNQLASIQQNWGPIGEGNAGRILNRRFGRSVSAANHGSFGTPKYDSLQAKLDRRFSNGVQMGFAYTWGHARAYTNEDSGAGLRTFAIPTYYDRMYSRASQDIRHNFQMTGIYEAPFGKGKKWATSGPASWILGGWQLNNLISLYTGQPFSVTAPSASLNAAASGQVADCIGEPRKLGITGGSGQFYAPDAFAQVTEARFGTCGLNILSGPGVFNLDLGLFRKFQVTERFDIQFRAEMFNVTNTPHFSNPNGDTNSTNFMLVTGIRNTGRDGIDERTFRFGLRLGW